MLDSTVRPIGAPIGDLQRALQVFSFEKLSDAQMELVQASVAGNDTIGILPTGHGKSACYQLPALITGERTIVISPLIALQQDQVRSLRMRGVKAFMLNSNMTEAEKTAVRFFFKSASPSCPAFLYVSPEMLLKDSFHHLFDDAGFVRLMVDEAHCVSTWGNSFRPDYGRIKTAAKRLGTRVCGAYTATADSQILKDIRARLPLRADAVLVNMDPARENLTLRQEFPASIEEPRTQRYEKKRKRLFELLTQGEHLGASLVYCGSRRGTDGLCEQLREIPDIARRYSVYPYHAEMEFEQKQKTHEAFKLDERPLIVATSAFGMGVDRADIRQVIHYHLPKTLIDYAQQIGRAGRDGLPSLCTTLRFSGELLASEGKAKAETPTINNVEYVYRLLRGVLANKTRAEAKDYDLSIFRSYVQKRVDGNTEVKNKPAAIARLNAALVLLIKARVITEDGGLTVAEFGQGLPGYEFLLKLTLMHERMLWREQERLRDFFSPQTISQSRLWELLRMA